MKTFEKKYSNPVGSLREIQWGSALGLSLLVLFIAVPLAWIFVYTVGYSFGMFGLLNRGFTFEHWRSAFSRGGLLNTTALSVGVSLAVTLIATVVSLTALLWQPHLRHQRIAIAMICVSMGTPSAIVAFLVYQLLSGGGLLSRIAYRAGLIESPTQFPQLVNDAFSIGIVVSLACGAIPLLLLYFSQLWTTIKADRLCEIAQSLGASRWQARTQVALPMLLGRGKSMIALVFLLNLGSYETPLLLGRQSPQMFSILAQQRSGLYDLTKRPEAFVMATVYMLLCTAILILYLRWKHRHA